MATIGVLKEAVCICRNAHVTPFIWGHRGLGKSALHAQLASDKGWGIIDMRCSQIEASDIRGLPYRGDDGRTSYLPPADLPKGDMTNDEVLEQLGTEPKDRASRAYADYCRRYAELQPRFPNGILFLDELNRAQDDVLQAAFELVLDRSVGQYFMPEGWSISCAGNYMQGYQVSGFNDPAFIDRFCHLQFSGGDATLEDWVGYMTGTHGELATGVVEFATQNVKHLDGEIEGELGFTRQPSRRSWDAVARVEAVCQLHRYSEQARHAVLAGLIGMELALSYERYSCPVKPRELLEKGVKHFHKQLAGLQRNQMVGLMWGLVSFCRGKVNDDKIAEVVLDFAAWMCKHAQDKDVVVALVRAMVSGGDSADKADKAKAAVISNPRLARMIGDYNKKRGNTEKTFIDRLNERPELQDALRHASWGDTDE